MITPFGCDQRRGDGHDHRGGEEAILGHRERLHRGMVLWGCEPRGTGAASGTDEALPRHRGRRSGRAGDAQAREMIDVTAAGEGRVEDAAPPTIRSKSRSTTCMATLRV